jgi:hypothetical protein
LGTPLKLLLHLHLQEPQPPLPSPLGEREKGMVSAQRIKRSASITQRPHRLECLQDRQTFRLLLVIDIPSTAQHLLRSLAFLSRDEMETGARGEERETNFVSNFQIDASSVLQQQRDDSGMTIEASEMETSISNLREMRGDQGQATLTLF